MKHQLASTHDGIAKSKRAKANMRVPPEIAQQIAWYIPDDDSFFAFLDAFQPHSRDALGLLQLVWHAQWVHFRCALWPHLNLQALPKHNVQAALPLIRAYPTVEAPDDLSMLVGAVGSSTNLIVRSPKQLSDRGLRKWCHHLADLPVVEVVFTAFPEHYSLRRMAIQEFCGVVPSMQYLRRVELTVADPDLMRSVVHCISQSNVVMLSLRGPTKWHQYNSDAQTLNGGIVAEFISWLTSKKVEAVALESYRFDCDDAAVQALYDAIAASETLTSLAWMNCQLPPAVPIALPRGLQKLQLTTHQHRQLALDGLWKALPDLSCLTHVDFTRTTLIEANAKALATALVGSSVRDLNLDTCMIGVAGCHSLASRLPQTRVKVLNLKHNFIRDEGAKALADAFQATASLRSVNLWGNALSASGVEAILRAVARRPYATEEVILADNDGVVDVPTMIWYSEIPPTVRVQLVG